MDDIVAIIVVAFIIGLAVYYIYKSKKRGQKCIGCPYANECMKKADTCSKNESCNCKNKK